MTYVGFVLVVLSRKNQNFLSEAKNMKQEKLTKPIGFKRYRSNINYLCECSFTTMETSNSKLITSNKIDVQINQTYSSARAVQTSI